MEEIKIKPQGTTSTSPRGTSFWDDIERSRRKADVDRERRWASYDTSKFDEVWYHYMIEKYYPEENIPKEVLIDLAMSQDHYYCSAIDEDPIKTFIRKGFDEDDLTPFYHEKHGVLYYDIEVDGRSVYVPDKVFNQLVIDVWKELSDRPILVVNDRKEAATNDSPIESYKQYVEWSAAIDRQPKNFVYDGKDERPDNVPIEWYMPHKHKKYLMKYIKKSYISGYEEDRSPVLTSLDEPCLCIHLPKLDLRITYKDYRKICAEVVDEMAKEGER